MVSQMKEPVTLKMGQMKFSSLKNLKKKKNLNKNEKRSEEYHESTNVCTVGVPGKKKGNRKNICRNNIPIFPDTMKNSDMHSQQAQ